jgi:hypothetical protein
MPIEDKLSSSANEARMPQAAEIMRLMSSTAIGDVEAARHLEISLIKDRAPYSMTEILSQYEHCDSLVKESIRVATDKGVKPFIAIGENHISVFSLINASMMMIAARHNGFDVCFHEVSNLHTPRKRPLEYFLNIKASGEYTLFLDAVTRLIFPNNLNIDNALGALRKTDLAFSQHGMTLRDEVMAKAISCADNQTSVGSIGLFGSAHLFGNNEGDGICGRIDGRKWHTLAINTNPKPTKDYSVRLSALATKPILPVLNFWSRPGVSLELYEGEAASAALIAHHLFCGKNKLPMLPELGQDTFRPNLLHPDNRIELKFMVGTGKYGIAIKDAMRKSVDVQSLLFGRS